jgi:uncharacterized protein (DUF849 family)
LKEPFYFNLIFGMIANAQAKPANMDLLIRELPVDDHWCYWSLGGVGDYQLSVNTFSIMYGGGVRVGLEDNIYYDRDRKRLATNMDLLKRIHRLADIFERPIMEPHEFGNMGFYNKCGVK